MRDSVIRWLRGGWRRREWEDFWALKDVSFSVEAGESIGIIGRNGAGKSTLLKILSRITMPTEGKVYLRGRVASLLEVGTGFHPELTGRENIFFNGSILGMSRKEIKRKFDEIVDFAGVEPFIDTPLKHYSSGMQLRLAFAVAAFLEAEILLIDEVLAVGDAEFQKKCLGKMEEVTQKQGRTIIFVSHNMGAVSNLCKKGIWLDGGKIKEKGNVMKVVSAYLNQNINTTTEVVFQNHKNKPAAIIQCRLMNHEHIQKHIFKTNETILIEITWVNNMGVEVTPNFLIINYTGQKVMIGADTSSDYDGNNKKEKGVYKTVIKIPPYLLNVNQYFIHLALDSAINQINYDVRMYVFYFTVEDIKDSLNEFSHRGAFKVFHDDVAIWPKLDSFSEKIK
ncbi:MAG: ABC transporter ATP-binding protein [Bacteroidia bacterium]